MAAFLCLFNINLAICLCSWVFGKGVGVATLITPFSAMAVLTFPSAHTGTPLALLAVIVSAAVVCLLMNEFDDAWLVGGQLSTGNVRRHGRVHTSMVANDREHDKCRICYNCHRVDEETQS
jgi:hypothetical protein